MTPPSGWEDPPAAGGPPDDGPHERDEVRHAVVDVARGRPDMAADPDLLDGYLRDVCPLHPAEVAVVVAAARAGVPEELARASEGHQAEATVARVAKRLNAEGGFDGPLSRWAIETWAAAVGALPPPVVGGPAPAPPVSLPPTVAPRAPAQQDVAVEAGPTVAPPPAGGDERSDGVLRAMRVPGPEPARPAPVPPSAGTRRANRRTPAPAPAPLGASPGPTVHRAPRAAPAPAPAPESPAPPAPPADRRRRVAIVAGSVGAVLAIALVAVLAGGGSGTDEARIGTSGVDTTAVEVPSTSVAPTLLDATTTIAGAPQTSSTRAPAVNTTAARAGSVRTTAAPASGAGAAAGSPSGQGPAATAAPAPATTATTPTTRKLVVPANQLVISPQSGPPGTVIKLSAGPCSRPSGWTGGEIYFGLAGSGYAVDPVTGKREWVAGAGWEDQITVPPGLKGQFQVYANCFAWDPQANAWNMFFLYPILNFSVT